MHPDDGDEVGEREPILPPGVAVCEGIPRASWHVKIVTLRNDTGDDVATRI